MDDALRNLLRGETLSEAATEAVFASMLAGGVDEPRIAALLALMAARGPTTDELVGAARAMRAVVARVPYQPPPGEALIDTCGTGGAPKTFNVSTAAALVVAAASQLPGALRRVRVAKHGNRSRTGRGSAETLALLGVDVDATPDTQARCLRDAGVCFCFAIHHHPATRFVAPVRRALPFPTIFNLLGPLTNPALAPRQLLGVYDARYVEPMAEALLRLGSHRAMVVHSADGMDEISTCAPTHFAAADADAARVVAGQLDPAALGVPRADPAALRCDSVEHAADILRRVLDGEPGAPRDIVEVNAAAALLVAGAADTLPDALALARAAIDAGAARETLRRLALASRTPA